MCWMKRRMSARGKAFWQIPQVKTTAYGTTAAEESVGRTQNYEKSVKFLTKTLVGNMKDLYRDLQSCLCLNLNKSVQRLSFVFFPEQANIVAQPNVNILITCIEKYEMHYYLMYQF